MKKRTLQYGFLTVVSIFLLFACKTQTNFTDIKPHLTMNFESSADMVKKGEKLRLNWNSNADTVFLNSGNEQKGYPPNYSITVQPSTATEYILIGRKSEQSIQRSVSVTIKKEPKKTPPKVKTVKEKHLYSQGEQDGRFTIGTIEGRRLMYGFPIPKSTSHIILKVDDAFASNYPGFETEYDTVYFSGEQVFSSEEGSVKSEITLMLDSVFVTQTLSPTDENLNPVASGGFGQYYHIAYKIENMSQDEKQVGFMTLLDLMLDNNDAPETYFGENMVSNEQGYAGDQIPDRFISLYEPDDFADFASETILKGGKANKPDSLFIGQWGPFHGFVWDVQTSGRPFGDSGYLLKWNERSLASGDSLMLSYYYGLPSKGQLRVLMNDNNMKSKELTVFFDKIGNSRLSSEAKNQLDNLITDNDGFLGGVIEGYGDAVGTDEENMIISKKRIQSVVRYLNSKGIKQEMLILKPYGETNALQTDETRENGNLSDRKAVISLYFTQ